MKKHDQTPNANCMGSDLAGKWAVLSNLRDFFSATGELSFIGPSLPSAAVSKLLGENFEQIFSFVHQEYK